MNFTDSRFLAQNNLKAHRGTIVKIKVFLIVSTVLMIVFVGSLCCLMRTYSDLTKQFSSGRFISYTADSEEKASAFRRYAAAQEGVSSVSVNALAVMAPPEAALSDEEIIELSVEDSFLTADGQKRTGFEQVAGKEIFSDKIIQYIPVWMEAFWIDDPDSFQLIPDCELEEYRRINQSDTVLSAGTVFTGEHQIMISEYMLSCYGFPKEEQAGLIGKPVSLGIIHNGTEYECISDYTLIGIIKTDYFGLSGKGSLAEQIWITYDASEPCLRSRYDIGYVENYGFSVYAYLESFDSYQGLADRFRMDGYPIDMNPLQLIGVFLQDGITLLKKIVFWLMAFFIIILILSICSSMYFYYQTTKQNYQMLAVLGAKEKTVKRICIYELLTVFGQAFLAAVLVSVSLFLFVRHFSAQMFRFDIKPSFTDAIIGTGTAGAFLAAFFLLIYIVLPRRMIMNRDKL